MITNMFEDLEKDVRKVKVPKENREISWLECEQGDVLRVWRKFPIPYMHYAIYTEEAKVIHFAGLEKDFWIFDDIYTHEAPFSHFLLDANRFEIVKYKKSYNPDEIVRRAYERLNRRGYSLLFNNCEHFAVYCATGEKRSQQVETVGLVLVNGVVYAATTAIPVTRPLRFFV